MQFVTEDIENLQRFLQQEASCYRQSKGNWSSKRGSWRDEEIYASFIDFPSTCIHKIYMFACNNVITDNPIQISLYNLFFKA